jgi:hypothetical protein
VKTEFAPMPEMNEETHDLWEGEMRKFFDKGGFTSLLKDVPAAKIQALDLNTYLPTFANIAKLNLKVEYIIPGLLPRQSITILHGRGGGLKTWLALEIGARISEGNFFAGLPTEKVPVFYADYENSLAMLIDRTKIIGPSEMRLWHISNCIPPPRLDSSDWILFKGLLPGLIIFDTLRSCQLLDENSSKDMALIMGRLKELREIGHTILLLHHTQKADSRTYKGSTAILDLCDHVLGLDRVKEIGSDQVVDEDEENLPLRLGTREKTRFEPFSMFLKFDPSHGFTKADDPDSEIMEDLKQLLEGHHSEHGTYPNQSLFQRKAKEDLDITKGQFRRLLRKGMGTFWVENKQKRANATLYFPVVQGRNDNADLEWTKDIEFSSFPVGEKKTEITTGNRFSGFPPLFIEEKTEQPDLREEEDKGE